jgi:hypothetical protein
LADVLMSRHEKASTLITANRGLDDWPKLLGDVVIVAPLIDRLKLKATSSSARHCSQRSRRKPSSSRPHFR